MLRVETVDIKWNEFPCMWLYLNLQHLPIKNVCCVLTVTGVDGYVSLKKKDDFLQMELVNSMRLITSIHMQFRVVNS